MTPTDFAEIPKHRTRAMAILTFMKPVVVKVIKRKELDDQAIVLRPLKHPPSVTATINDWIAESRRNRLDESRSRKMIAGWAIEANV